MFKLYANKSQLTLREREPLTTGSVNVNTIRFEFSADWEGLTKTAVFRAGEESRSILLDGSGECMVPWEVLVSPHSRMFAGVYGTREKEVVLPTIWADLGVILEGAAPGGELYPPTPELWEQELAKKQDKLHGRLGQLVGFGENGSAVAQDAEELMQGPPGADGATYTPVVSAEGILSWTNDKGLPNPAPVNIKGPAGADGAPGSSGVDSADGVGVPAGGAVGQVLAKKTAADYDTQWVDAVDGDITSYIINAPVGAILAWSGTGDNIPTGWHVCNGEGGTLDLRDRFILGAGQNHAVGDTGGSEEVTLTVEQMPEHTHIKSDILTKASGYNYGFSRTGSAEGFNNLIGYNAFQMAGSSQPHPNMPPYYALLYIQKTGTTPEDYATEESVDTKIDALTQVKGIYTQSEFDALPETEQSKGMYVISEEGSSTKITINGETAEVAGGSGAIVQWEDIIGRPDLTKVSSMIVTPIVLVSSAWVSNQQIIPIEGILANETAQLIIPIPAQASKDAYKAAGIEAVSQSENSITFQATSVPESDLNVNVYIFGAAEVEEEYTGVFEWWSPLMVSNTTPTPYVVTASSVFSGDTSRQPYKAFNDNLNNFWTCNSGALPAWIAIDLGKPTVINGIAIHPIEQAYSKDTPETFKVYGSDNGVDWVEVYSGTNDAHPDEWLQHTFDNSVKYRHYKLGDMYPFSATSVISIAGIRFNRMVKATEV